MARSIRRRAGVLALVTVAASAASIASAQGPVAASFTTAQADRGKAAYAASCASCHGDNLNDGTFGPALKGETFQGEWRGKTADRLFTNVKSTMPSGAPGSISDAAYADVIAYILQANAATAGDKDFSSDPATSRTMTLFAK